MFHLNSNILSQNKLHFQSPALKMYYFFKPYIPRKSQIRLRRELAKIKRHRSRSNWPISDQSAKLPRGWKGWKNNKQFALVLTHDVDTQKGYDNHEELMKIDQEMGFCSSFNFVPERYDIDLQHLMNLKNQGFEVGVHGLKHDGKLLQSKEIFLKRAQKINEYIKSWGACGFRAPSMHRDLELFKHLNIAYDASTFDTDPFEPQSEGVHTIFPFCVENAAGKICYWELPYTLAQDSTLFIIFQEESIDIWIKKIDWIAEHGGMALLNTHPDYMRFDGSKPGFEDYPAKHYIDFLSYIKTKYGDCFWNPLPRDMVKYFDENIN